MNVGTFLVSLFFIISAVSYVLWVISNLQSHCLFFFLKFFFIHTTCIKLLHNISSFFTRFCILFLCSHSPHMSSEPHADFGCCCICSIGLFTSSSYKIPEYLLLMAWVTEMPMLFIRRRTFSMYPQMHSQLFDLGAHFKPFQVSSRFVYIPTNTLFDTLLSYSKRPHKPCVLMLMLSFF